VPTLDQRLAFASEHIRTKEGKRFNLTGRDWVVDEFWRPCDSFKWWPHDINALCDGCMAKAGTITDWTSRNPTTTEKHRASGCLGLELAPIIMTVLALPRREGKTFNTAAYNLSTICLSHHKSITYMAAAGDQTKQLFHENYALPIMADRKLSKACVVTADQVHVHGTHSFLECVPTSHASVTGRGRSHIVIDEARDVGARVLTAFLPSVNANNGWECPRGHVHSRGTGGREAKTCSVCREPLVPWFGRIILMSSAGILDGGDRDWFADLVEQLETQPDKNAHLYKLTESTNPDVAKQSTGMMERIFGNIESTRVYMDAELHNTPRRKGEDFVSPLDIQAVVDPYLKNAHGSAHRCVAFLDTSLSSDSTSLVICSEEPAESDAFERAPWERLVVERIDAWEPKKLPGGVIDPAMIMAHLDLVLPMFPALVSLRVDTRVMPWAVSLVRQCQQPPQGAPPARRGWGRKVDKFQGNTAERDASWSILEQRILSRTIRIPALDALIKELKGVRRVTKPSGRTEIRDRARQKVHADIAEALAACCYLAHLETLSVRASLDNFVNRRSEASSILDRVCRPVTAKLNPNSF
jgi:hypothetical protein